MSQTNFDWVRSMQQVRVIDVFHEKILKKIFMKKSVKKFFRSLRN